MFAQQKLYTHHDIVVLIGGETEYRDTPISKGCNNAGYNLADPGEAAHGSNLNDQRSPLGLLHLNGTTWVYGWREVHTVRGLKMSYILRTPSSNVTPLGWKMCPELLTGEQQSTLHEEVATARLVLKLVGGLDMITFQASSSCTGSLVVVWWTISPG